MSMNDGFDQYRARLYWGKTGQGTNRPYPFPLMPLTPTLARIAAAMKRESLITGKLLQVPRQMP